MQLPFSGPRGAPAVSDQAAQLQERGCVLVMWIVWFAEIVAGVVLQFTLGHGIPTGKNAPVTGISPILVVVLVLLFSATAVRWLILPKVRHTLQKLRTMVIGLALSYAPLLFGIFLFPADQPETRLVVFLLAMASLVQFVPTYARSDAGVNRLPGAWDKRP